MGTASPIDTTSPVSSAAGGRRGWFAALLCVYCGSLVALTAPTWLAPGSRVLGHPDSDVWRHLWGDAWFVRDLGKGWPVPLSTDLLWYPDGGLLYNLDPLSGIAARLLAPILGLVLAHNLIQLGALLLGAVATYLLARRWIDPAGAAAAGAVYGFSAHLQGTVLVSGIGETAHVGWIPLALLALVRLTDGRGWRWVVVGGGALALAALGSWYYGLVASLAAVGLVVVWGVRRLRPGVEEPPAAPSFRRTLLLLGATAFLAALLIAPFAMAFRISLDPERALHDVAVAGVLEEDLSPRYNVAVATVRDFLVPGDPRICDSRDRLAICHHPGFLPLVLALIAVLARRPGSRALAIAGALAMALTMGARFHLDPDWPLAPNPVFLGFQAAWPTGGLVRNLERLQVGFTLCLALMAGFGASWMLDVYAVRGALRRVAGLALVVLLVAEANAVSGLGFPLPAADVAVPALYDRITAEPGQFAVIELPHTDGPTGRPFWYQVSHGRPLPFNFEGQVAPSLTRNPFVSELITDRAFHSQFAGIAHQDMSPEQMERGRQALVRQGFRFAVVRDRPGDDDLIVVQSVRRLLDEVVGGPVAEDRPVGLALYDLDRTTHDPGRRTE